MENESYKKRDVTISLWVANCYAIFTTLPILIVLYLLYSFVWEKPTISFVYPYWLIYLIGVVIHELIHGYFAMKYSKKGIKSIKFGISWKFLTPYCHCKEPLTVKNYRIVVLAPFIILGIFPTLIGIIIGHNDFYVFGLMFILAAGGDLVIIWKLKNENETSFALDSPDKCGYEIYESEKL